MPSAIQIQQSSDELISDEVKEIISYRPHWIIRKGNVLFFVVLASLLALTWFIKYPDIVKGSTRLVALNAPKLINAKTEGKLVKLFVSNEDGVQKDQHLGYIESTGDYEEIVKLKNWIDEAISKIQINYYAGSAINPLPTLFNLGALQPNYQAFQTQWLETKQILASGYYQKKKAALQKDLNYIASLKNNTYKQQQLHQQDEQLQKTELKAYESLAKDKVIAPLELNQYKSKLLAKEQNMKQIDAQLTNSSISSHNKEKEILDLQKSISDQHQKFNSALLDLKSAIEEWTKIYVLVASENGKVLFTSSLQEGELIASGQSLFYIQPAQTKFYAELLASQKGLGKIKTGQKVMIKIESYPHEEYGYVHGVVKHIAAMPNRRDSFSVKVDLPKGLQTNHDKQLFFRNNLSAQAEIITDDRRLFDRLTGQLKKVWQR